MNESIRNQLTPGTLVEVTQQIPHRDRTWTNTVRGVIESYQQKQTGSWFAHARGDKLWLDRLSVRKDDGEVFTFNLDEYTRIDILEDAPAVAAGT